MHKAINAKFKKGDKVVSKEGRRGYISEVYGEGWYAVHFDGDRIDLDNKMQEYQLRAANCSTANSVVAKAVANARAANSSAEPTVAKNGADNIVEKQFGAVRIVDWGNGGFDCSGELGSISDDKNKVVAWLEKKIEKTVADYKKAIAYIKTR